MRKSRKIQGPEPFKTMPLVYERAFGGADRSPEDPEDHEVDARNPVGAGFLAKKNAIDGPIPLPNLEDPAQPIQTPEDRPPPAGFGFIAPHWESRAQYAGTYDEAWLTNRMPLLPQDFQRRFFNAAHSDLVSKDHLKGGEAVEILNASPRGALTFRLPTETPEGVVMMKDGTRHALSMPLDTVIVNTDEHRVFLVWRGSVSVHKKVHDILWIKAQPRGAGRAHAA